MNFKNEQLKLFEKEYKSQFDDYRDEKEEEKELFINENLSQLPLHQLLKQLSLNDLLRSYDANSLYPSGNVGSKVNLSKNRNWISFYSRYE